MSSSKIRKAIGVVKDQTSISIAKVAGNIAPDLEVLIVKATGHDSEPAEDKYIREILHLTSQSRGYVSACVYNISKRLSKTHDWVVALKSLMLVHRLLIDGDPVFGQEIMFASRKGTRVLNMSDFWVEALSNYWDHSRFVKNYGMYLNQKLEFIAFERKLSPLGFRDDHGYGISHKSRSYGDLDELWGERKDVKVVRTPLREMKPDRVLERLNKLLRLIDRVLSCRPAGSAKSSKMVFVALCLVLKESFRIYADICEALGVLLDRFQEMEYGNCVKTFDQYVNAAKTIDELVDFYSWSKESGVVRASAFPEVQKVTDKILGTLERFLRDKKNKLKKEMEECYEEIEPSPPAMVATMEDVLNMKDDIVPPVANHGTMLSHALFSGPNTVETNGASVVDDGKVLRFSHIFDSFSLRLSRPLISVSSSDLTIEIRVDLAPASHDYGRLVVAALLLQIYQLVMSSLMKSYGVFWLTLKFWMQADWELALVEAASNLSKQQSSSGLDPVMLNGMYDQGAARHQMNYNQVCAPPVLALPAPNEKKPVVNLQDPFAASLMVPPPPYVQLADMEKKRGFIVQEQQQVWQSYGSNAVKVSGGVAAYNAMEQQAGFTYAHY
ncbi:hypothetical protein E3N88_05934 [Mikania micrantha]|uniref:ENTH domain-containing protein n=1 Tax=Mikania micrantha TaxID=192012 RepID=A0A5N6PME6_9ASTR|nr:hypothetical protein E3N88_05934 [Mikania micrantha]